MNNLVNPGYYHKAAEPQVQDYFNKLVQFGFKGICEGSWSTRLSMATDNSIYHILPAGVLFPKTSADIDLIFETAQKPEFRELTFSPRGGGTGTNGQSLNTGIIIDCSRYMNNILEINEEEKWVRVEAGVVLDQLNSALKPKGLFFAPSLSPSNRATLGGMINTDASGKGSLIYGKTSNHILELTCHLLDGSRFQTKTLELTKDAAPKFASGEHDKVSQSVLNIVNDNTRLIEETFPQIDRFLTGYNLKHVIKDNQFNLNSLIAGSEGTLCFVSEAKLKLTPLPTHKKLLVIKYPRTSLAMESTAGLLKAKPSAIETIDHVIINQAKSLPLTKQVSDFLYKDIENNTPCLNLIEFTGNNESEIFEKMKGLHEKFPNSYIPQNDKEENEFWWIRKKGVELLTSVKGLKRPVPFIEDTVVPPENLAKYIVELKELLKEYNLEYGLFGHADVGCIHIRPKLDMQDPEDEVKIRRVSDKVVQLVKKYGGLIWGEHGKGFRSEYIPEFFGETLHTELRKIKALFDPENRLNPGKIVTPYGSKDQVYPLESPKVGHYNRKVPIHLQPDYPGIMDCNGNGLCYHYDSDNIMCPTFHQSGDRLESPRGRAILMKEWLRTSEMNERSPEFVEDIFNTMEGCLSCKACTTQCPVEVNISEHKSRFLKDYYQSKKRPLRDYFIGYSEQLLLWQTKLPYIATPFSNLGIKALQSALGMVDLPSQKPGKKLQHALLKLPYIGYKQTRLPTPVQGQKQVILYVDPITQVMNPALVLDTCKLFSKLNVSPVILRDFPSGKPLHLKGFLKAYKEVVNKNASFLDSFSDKNIPIVAIEPSTGLSMREEYLEYGDPKFKMLLLQEFLQDFKAQFKSAQNNPEPYYLLNHCHESALVSRTSELWRELFRLCGQKLIGLESSCCGMAGAHGHEAKNAPTSREIYSQSWEPKIKKYGDRILVTGYSCRSQVERFEGFEPRHPIELLNTLV